MYNLKKGIRQSKDRSAKGDAEVCLWMCFKPPKYFLISNGLNIFSQMLKCENAAPKFLQDFEFTVFLNILSIKCWAQEMRTCSDSTQSRPHFYQTRSAWSMDQGSNKNHSPVNNCAPTVTKFCVMWEGQALPYDTKFSNCRDKIVDSRAFLSWSLIHGSSWSGLIKLGPGIWYRPFTK